MTGGVGTALLPLRCLCTARVAGVALLFVLVVVAVALVVALRYLVVIL